MTFRIHDLFIVTNTGDERYISQLTNVSIASLNNDHLSFLIVFRKIQGSMKRVLIAHVMYNIKKRNGVKKDKTPV